MPSGPDATGSRSETLSDNEVLGRLNRLQATHANIRAIKNDIVLRINGVLDGKVKKYNISILPGVTLGQTPYGYVTINTQATIDKTKEAIFHILSQVPDETRADIVDAIRSSRLVTPLPTADELIADEDALELIDDKESAKPVDDHEDKVAEDPPNGYVKWAKDIAYAPVRAASSVWGRTKSKLSNTASGIKKGVLFLPRVAWNAVTGKYNLIEKFVNLAENGWLSWVNPSAYITKFLRGDSKQ